MKRAYIVVLSVSVVSMFILTGYGGINNAAME